MARARLLGICEYDPSGRLDFFIHGPQWLSWYKRRKGLFSSIVEPVFIKARIKQEIMTKFERALDLALSMDRQGANK